MLVLHLASCGGQDPENGQLQMVAIKRRDTGVWAIPGGMVDAGEQVCAAVFSSHTPVAWTAPRTASSGAFAVPSEVQG